MLSMLIENITTPCPINIYVLFMQVFMLDNGVITYMSRL